MSGLAANIKIKTIFCFQTDYFNHEILHSLTDQIFKQKPYEKLEFRKVNDCLICFSTYGLKILTQRLTSTTLGILLKITTTLNNDICTSACFCHRGLTKLQYTLHDHNEHCGSVLTVTMLTYVYTTHHILICGMLYTRLLSHSVLYHFSTWWATGHMPIRV